MRSATQIQDQLFALIEEAVKEKRVFAQKSARNKLAMTMSVEFLSSHLAGGGSLVRITEEVTQAEYCSSWARFSHAIIDAHLGPLDPPKEEAPDAAPEG